MSEPEVVTAAVVRPCIVKNTTDTSGVCGPVFRASCAGAPAMGTVTLPAKVKGCWLDLVARGVGVQYGFVLDGTTKPTLVYDTVVVGGTGATDGVAGAQVLSGERLPVKVPKDAKELVYIWEAATASAIFEGTLSSRKT